ncbi:hypothetical protein, partial [Corynebacterium heidelbergense]|uniref:hypothetical protein n=1 Tax=Corynebacterium heidelbergense TaxID=2055947 RepID=UPI0011BEFDEF
MPPTGTLHDLPPRTERRTAFRPDRRKTPGATQTPVGPRRVERAAAASPSATQTRRTSPRTGAAAAPRTSVGARRTVSVRGRRVVDYNRANSAVVRLVGVVAAMLIVGIAVIMYLSAVTTDQSFRIAEARKQTTSVGNELESLERDVTVARSSGHVAERAAQLGMVVPNQPGVLEARGADGRDIVETRPSNAEGNRPIQDVNGRQQRRGATSTPAETANVPGLAPSDPAGQAAVIRGTPGQPAGAPQAAELPYAPSTGPAAPVAPPAAAAPAAPPAAA